MEVLPGDLISEIKHNMQCFQRDLSSVMNPDDVVDDFAEGYVFVAYNKYAEQLESEIETAELLAGFYRSIEVLQTGHPNLFSAEPSELENAYRTLIESAIGFGEFLIGESEG